jgi:site-specific DNA recombinase
MSTKDTANHTPRTAIIYARVSDSKQKTEGDGLNSQEARCREYAARKGYAVAAVFHDDITGKAAVRPAFEAMKAFVKRHRDQHPVVIIDDISRFARDIEAHWHLRRSLKEVGGTLESPTIEFGDDPDSVLIENLLASVAQHHREKNGQQVINRMRGRLMNGYWVFWPPAGYTFTKQRGGGSVLSIDPPVAALVREALEGYASGRFESQAEVRRFIEQSPHNPFPKDVRGAVHQSRIAEMLERPLYAGYVSYEPWGVSMVQGKHEPIISLETYLKIQSRRMEGVKAAARPDISEDFPARGFVLCGDCEKPMTACWSAGRLKKYAYYSCNNKACGSYRKSIPRAKVEGALEEMLKDLTPAPVLFDLVRRMFQDAWNQRSIQSNQLRKDIKVKIAGLDKDITRLLDRIVDTSSPSVIKAYEDRIEKLETEKLLLSEQMTKLGQPQRTLEDSFEHTMRFLANPYNIWEKGDLILKRTVLRLAFLNRVIYDRNEGVRTPELSLPFKCLREISMLKKEMVGPAGLEPATRPL